MTTSGTLATQIFDVNRIIESAYKRCKIPPSALTGEQVEDALDLLGLFLSQMPTRGAQLWTLERKLLGMKRGNPMVVLPVGTTEVRSAGYRQVTRLTGTISTTGGGVGDNLIDGDLDTACTQSVPNGYFDLDLGETTAIQLTGFAMAADLTATIKILTSTDGTTFTERLSFAECAYEADEFTWAEFDGTVYARYVRFQETGGATLNVREWVVGASGTLIPLTRMNIDQYASMPSRFTESRPTQYWMSRTHERMTMNLWPAPNASAGLECLEVYRKRLIQDVGKMSNTLEIPLTWYEAVIAGLAARLAVADEKVQPNLIPILKAEAKEALDFAISDQRDPSPIVFRPNIARYTR